VSKRYVANLQIKVGGAPLGPTVLQDVQAVTVNDDLRMASTFTLKLNTWSSKLLKMTWSDQPLFSIGARVEISPGYVDGPLQSVILGEITDLECEYSDGQPPVLTVTGYDLRHRLARSSVTQTYNTSLDSDVAGRVIGRNELPSSVTVTSTQYAHTTQNNETDLAFLNRLAWRNNYDLTILGETVRFAPASIFGPPVALEMDKDVTSFSVALAASMLVDKVNVTGRDVSSTNNQEFQVSAPVSRYPGTLGSDQLKRFPSVVTDLAISTQAEGQAIANAKANDAGMECLTGSGSGYGNNALRAGMTVNLTGLGTRFSGQYRLWSVTHSCSPENGYTTSFRVKGVP
jgi:phage protein D